MKKIQRNRRDAQADAVSARGESRRRQPPADHANDGARAIPQILDAVEKAGDAVTSINVQKLSLEDVFIEFTGRTLRDEPAKKVSLLVGAGMPQRR